MAVRTQTEATTVTLLPTFGLNAINQNSPIQLHNIEMLKQTNTVSVADHFLCTMTNKYTTFSHIITLLHFSTLSCHPQGVVINTLPSYTRISNVTAGNNI
jgi:hypothetical protein